MYTSYNVLTCSTCVLAIASILLFLQEIQLFTFVTFYIAFALVAAQFVLTFVTDRGAVVPQRSALTERTPLLGAQNAPSSSSDEGRLDTQPLKNPNLACNFLSNAYMAWFVP